MLQTAHGHLCPHIAKDDSRLFSIDSLYLPDGRKTFYPYGITYIHHTARLLFPHRILQCFGGCLLLPDSFFQVLFVPFLAALYFVDFLLEVLI